MPRKKTTKYKQSQVQKQKIAARLLEVSFKADDYIYKKKSISVEHAKKYLEEVEKFEPKCQGDIRSMQVIEKLTDLMKSIIEQGKTSQGRASQSLYNPLNITSTNASTLDSTLKSTRSIQVQTNKSFENILDRLEKNTNTGDDFEKNSTTESHLRMQVIEAAVEFNLERTLSNLSLSIIDPVNKETFKNSNKISGVEDLNFIGFNEKEENLSVIDIPDQASKDQIQTKQCTDSSQVQNDTVAKTPSYIITIDDDDDGECQKYIVNTKPSTTTTLESYDEIIVKHSINKPKKPDVESKKIQPKKSKDGPKKQKDGNKAKENANNAKPKRSRRNSKVNLDTILPKDIITESKNRRRRKCTKETVCDLSWVENIKFVRVIEPSEYETSFDLQDSFWGNCYLPYDFSQYF